MPPVVIASANKDYFSIILYFKKEINNYFPVPFTGRDFSVNIRLKEMAFKDIAE